MSVNNNICPKCGSNLGMVGKVHRCVERKVVSHADSSGSHDDDKTMKGKGVVQESEAGASRLRALPASDLKSAYNQYMREYMRQWRAKRREKK